MFISDPLKNIKFGAPITLNTISFPSTEPSFVFISDFFL